MKNKIIDKMHSKVCVEIRGKTPERFILRLHKSKIDIIQLNKVNKEQFEIIINYADYEKLLKINTIYEIKIIKYLGMVKTKHQIFKYYHVILSILICIIGIYLLSNLIFQVEVVTNDDDMRNRLLKTLQEYNIKKYQLKKNYRYLQDIKNKILEEYHDEIEWVEIDSLGTKYILRYEPRIVKNDTKENTFRHVIAKKNAVIHSVYSSSGQIIKNKYAYVKKGDIIISGYIYANEKIQETVRADGNVYGEVWYVTKVTYPFNYYEERKTGNSKYVYSVKLFNKTIELFNFKPFNDKIVKEELIIENKLLPIKLVKQFQEEVVITTDMNVVEEMKLKAISLAYDKMNENLKDDEYIISHRVLESKILDKGIEMKIFFSVCENISDYVEIEEMKEVE